MVEIIEFPEGTDNMEMMEAEREYKKDCLAKKLCITREELDEQVNTIKKFFELNKKNIMK